MLKTLFVCLLLNVLVFTTCMQHKADLVVLHVLLLPCRFLNFFLATFPSFIKWSLIRSCIFLFLLNAIVGLLTKTLPNSGLICRIDWFFLMTTDIFCCMLKIAARFFHFFAKAVFVQLSQPCIYGIRKNRMPDPWSSIWTLGKFTKPFPWTKYTLCSLYIRRHRKAIVNLL